MTILRMPLLLACIATGISSFAEEVPPASVIEKLRELEWGEELTRIRFVSVSPLSTPRTSFTITQLIEIKGQCIRWEMVDTREERVSTTVVGTNADYAFHINQNAIGEPWSLVRYQASGQSPPQGHGIKKMLERELTTLRKIPYGWFTKAIDADFLERFIARATRDIGTKTITINAELRPDLLPERNNPVTDVEIVVDEESYTVRAYRIHGILGLLKTGSVDFPEEAGKRDTSSGYRWIQETQTETKPNSIKLRKTVLDVIADDSDRDIDLDSFYLGHYGIQMPASNEANRNGSTSDK